MISLPRSALVTLLLFSIIVSLVPFYCPAQVEAPMYHKGMSWKYLVALNVTNDPNRTSIELEGTLKSEIGDLLSIAINKTEVGAYEVLLSGGGEAFVTMTVPNFGPQQVQGEWVVYGNLFLDNKSYEYVKSNVTVEIHGNIFGLSYRMVIASRTESEISKDTWNYPFSVGDEGSVLSNATMNSTYEVWLGSLEINETQINERTELSGTYSCVSHSGLRVPAGDFEAYEIEATGNPPLFGVMGPVSGRERLYYSPDARNNVKVLYYDNDEKLVAHQELISYSTGDGGNAVTYWLWVAIPILFLLLVAVIVFVKGRGSVTEIPGAPSKEAPTEMICRWCGTKIPVGDVVCPNCGRTVF